MSKDNRKNQTSRLNKYLPDEGFWLRQIRDGSLRINVYSWHNNPVELWAWDIGPAGPTRIELHKLENYPTRENIEQALAMYLTWREEYRRQRGEIAGPGLEKDTVLRECYRIWEESGHDEGVLKELAPKYVNSRPNPHNASAIDSYYRQMRRLRAKYKKNQKP